MTSKAKVKTHEHLMRVNKIIDLLKNDHLKVVDMVENLKCSRNSVGRALTTIRNLGFNLKQDFKLRYYIR